MTSRRSAAKPWLLLFVAVCLVAINMRQTITGVGPLLDDIASEQGVTPATLGALASIPLFAWAVVSPLSQSFAARVGVNTAVSWALVSLTAATVWRSLPGSPLNLWLGTALIGASLAIANVLLPAVIKRDFGTRVPLVMGLYSALLGVSGALGAGIVAPISHHITASGEPVGWRWALAATGLTLPIAVAVWVFATRFSRQGAAEPSPATGGNHTITLRVWRDPVAWRVALYMGAMSSVFYILANWLSPIMVSQGIDAVTAGSLVMLFHVFDMLGSVLSPLVSRGASHRLVPLIVPVMSIVGGLGVVIAPGAMLVWLIIGGLSVGASLSIALTFVAQRAPSIEVAGALSGMTQAFGYSLAAFGPILFGWGFGAAGTWVIPLVILTFFALLQFGAGLSLWRDRQVFER